jgi:hypothetical protein
MTAPAPFYQRLLWMIAIWSLSVGALGLVAVVIRFMIRR